MLAQVADGRAREDQRRTWRTVRDLTDATAGTAREWTSFHPEQQGSRKKTDMVSYDTTQIALFVSLVLTVAAIGTLLVLGMVVETLVRSRRIRVTSSQSRRVFHGRLAFHH